MAVSNTRAQLKRLLRPCRMPSSGIQRRLERTSAGAVLLGYGLLLVVNLQVFSRQRDQHQLDTMDRAERLLLLSSADQADDGALQRSLNHFSTFDRAIWGQPTGSSAGMVMPQLSSNDFIASNPVLRERAQDLARSASRPQTFEHEARTYTVSTAAFNLSDQPWRWYLLTDVSQDVALQRQLNLILTVAALLASLVTLILNRRGIQRSLLPLRRFGDTLSAVRSSSLQQQRFEPDQEPEELQPLAHAFNALLDRLTESFERQRQFASTVSHELRNPITLIGGYSRRLLRRSDNLTDDQRHQLGIVDEESRRLGRLVTDLLALTRAETGSFQLDLKPLSVCDAVQQAIDLADGAGERRFLLRPGDGIDPHTLQAWADRDRVVQCLVNLIENACKYSPPHAPVEIGCSTTSSEVELRVRDHGLGIPTEEKSLIFERFRRGKTHSGIPGSGIGLAVVKTLVSQMEGEVHVEDADEGGAVFVIRLKRFAPPSDPPLPRHHL